MSIKHVYTQTVADDPATSIVRPSDWNSAHNLTLNISGNTAGTSQISGTDIVWAGGNNITLSASAGSVTISGPTNAGQTVQTLGLYGVGNTTQNSSTTLDARTLSFDGLGAATVGFSNGSVQLSVPVQSVQPVGTFGVSNVGNTSGTSSMVTNQMVLAGGNNITLSESTAAGGITVTISGPNTAAQTNQTVGLYAVGNTTQNSSTTLDARTLSFDGLGGVTVGYSNGSVQISGPQTAAQTNQTVGLYAVGNTTQNSSTTLDARTLSFDGLGAATLGFSNGSVQVSVPVQTNQSVGVYASSQTTGQSSSSTVDARSFTHVGQGIVSVGLSAGSLLISATTVAQTNQTIGAYATNQTTGQSSSTTFDARSFSVSGAGIISAGMSTTAAGAPVLVISATDAAQTNQSLGVYATGNTTGNSSSETYDARSLTIEFDGIVSGGWSTNNSHLIVSAVQSNQTAGLYAVGNTTGATTSTTVDARSISFDGLGIASVGFSNGSVQISVPSGGGAGDGYNFIEITGNTSGTTTSFTTGTVVLAGGNNITLSESTGAGIATITISAANQSNQTVGLYAVGETVGQSSSTTVDARTVSFDGAGGISVGFSAGSVVVSHAQISQLSFGPLGPVSAASTLAIKNGTLWVEPLVCPLEFPVSRMNLWASVNLNGTSIAATTSSTQSTTYSGGTSINAILYTLGTGASSSALYTVLSTRLTLSYGQTISESSNSFTATLQIGYPTGLSNTSSFSTGSVSTSQTTNATNVQTNLCTVLGTNSFNGLREFFLPFGTTLSAGNYVIGQQTLTTGTSGPIGLSMQVCPPGNNITAASGYFGQASNNSLGFLGQGHGIYSVSFSTAISSNLNLSDIAIGNVGSQSAVFGHLLNYGT